MRTLSNEELSQASGGINVDLLLSGFVTGAVGCVAVVSGLGLVVASVGGIAVLMGGAAVAAGLGDLSGNGGGKTGSVEVNWNVGGDPITVCSSARQCSGPVTGSGEGITIMGGEPVVVGHDSDGQPIYGYSNYYSLGVL